MLRRSKTIVFRDDSETQNGPPSSSTRPRLDRSGLELLRNEAADTSVPDDNAQNAPQQRLSRLRADLQDNPISKGSPQSLEALRAEFQRTLAAGRTDDDDVPLPRNGPGVPSFVRSWRMLLIVVALLAGGAAAWVATQMPAAEPAPAPVVVAEPAPPPPPPMVQVLVAAQPIAVGKPLTADLLQWQDWPEAALRPEFITTAAEPEAIESMADSVARASIAPGEPILREKLGAAGEGYLSAILAPGKRGVSIIITPESASGGFIVPNDHVDVVLTRTQTGGRRVSQTILHGVRVIAIGPRLGPSQVEDGTEPGDAFAGANIATLELDSSQAELMVGATGGGDLSLVLRPLSDSAGTAQAERDALNQSIRMTSPFWQGAAQ